MGQTPRPAGTPQPLTKPSALVGVRARGCGFSLTAAAVPCGPRAGCQVQDTQREVGQDLGLAAVPVPGRTFPDLPWMPPSACQRPPGQDFFLAMGQRPRWSPGPG